MRLVLALLVLTLAGPAAFAQETAPALPEPLAELLSAAHATGVEEDFTDAVRLIALTEDAQSVAAAADAIAPARGVEARAVLGLPEAESAALAAAETAPAASDPSRTRAARPLAIVGALASGESELWEGRAELGLRFDSGNSDRQDYKIGVSVERALSVWGFEAAANYAYSEVDGAVGRDEFDAEARAEREAGERWTWFVHGDYEQDALDGYDWSAFVGAGAGYRVFDRPERAWVLRAGPGARIVKDPAGETMTDPALELSSDFEMQISEPVRFASKTSALLSENSRAQQSFTLDTALGELWSLALTYRYTYEFEPEPGFENEDSRTDISIVRLF